MKECISREAALAALKEYNKEPFHILHGLTVEGVMRWYANELGYGDEADFWATVGLLHDIDFEMWPEQHCLKAPELLQKAGCSPEFIHAVCSHGYGLCCDVEPTHQMAPQQECDGHGGQQPEEEVQGQEVRRRLLPRCYQHRRGASGLDGRGSDGKDHSGHAQLRGKRQQGDGDAGLRRIHTKRRTPRVRLFM